jgi:hypothetical protein
VAELPNPLASVEANFRRLLATGQPVALEDAAEGIDTPEGFDRRAFGSIPHKMQRDGEILEPGYRRAASSRCNSGMKRLWVLATAREGNSRA